LVFTFALIIITGTTFLIYENVVAQEDAVNNEDSINDTQVDKDKGVNDTQIDKDGSTSKSRLILAQLMILS